MSIHDRFGQSSSRHWIVPDTRSYLSFTIAHECRPWYWRQWQCIVLFLSFFYIRCISKYNKHWIAKLICRCIKIQKRYKTRGPMAFYRSHDNQQQTAQSEKRQPEWQDSNNARVVGNTSVCCCKLLVWRRISSKEKPLLYLCLPCPGSTPWNIWPKPLPEWQHSK